MYATPTRSSNPLSGFSPGLSPISQSDLSMQQNLHTSAYNTPDRSIYAKLNFPANQGTPGPPLLPRIVEESSLSDSNAQEKSSPSQSQKPAPLVEATAMQSMSLLDLTPERPKVVNSTALLDSVSYLPTTPAFPRPVERRTSGANTRDVVDGAPDAPLSADQQSTDPAGKTTQGTDASPNDLAVSSRERYRTSQELIQDIKEKYQRWVGDGKERDSSDRKKDIGVSTDDIPIYRASIDGNFPVNTPQPAVFPPSTPVETIISNVNTTAVSAASALPVGSLYALVLDHRSNPLLRSSSPLSRYSALPYATPSSLVRREAQRLRELGELEARGDSMDAFAVNRLQSEYDRIYEDFYRSPPPGRRTLAVVGGSVDTGSSRWPDLNKHSPHPTTVASSYPPASPTVAANAASQPTPSALPSAQHAFLVSATPLQRLLEEDHREERRRALGLAGQRPYRESRDLGFWRSRLARQEVQHTSLLGSPVLHRLLKGTP
eukprot:gene27252-32922_t